MATGYIFRYDSIAEKTLIKALNHNKRVLQNERGAKQNINAAKSPLNYALHGDDTPKQIENYARSLIALAGIKRLRKNVVMAVEVLYSLPVDWHDKDSKPYFDDCYQWTLKTFGGVLLSFDIHLDESAPHAHAIILPLIDGKMQGDKLKGNGGVIKKRQRDFYNDVANQYGFAYNDSKRLKAEDKKSIAREVMKRLNGDAMQTSAIYPWVRDKIYQDPLPLAQMLGVDTSPAQQAKNKHFVDIARSKGKGEFIK